MGSWSQQEPVAPARKVDHVCAPSFDSPAKDNELRSCLCGQVFLRVGSDWLRRDKPLTSVELGQRVLRNEHRCQPPSDVAGHPQGAVGFCDCGRRFVLTASGWVNG